jgi:acetyl-CoA carboxylase beta subunit
MKVIITESQYERLKNEMATITPKDDTAKWIKCKNCKKFFTQTIHKKKKSLPICIWCGTHNN